MKRKSFLCLLVLTLICLSYNVSSAQKQGGGKSKDIILADTVNCSGICNSSTWTYNQGTTYQLQGCVLNYYFRRRSCVDSINDKFILETEILRIQVTGSCTFSIPDIMSEVISKTIGSIITVDTSHSVDLFELNMLTSKCWKYDPLDRNAIISCDSTSCYLTTYLLYIFKYPNEGVYLVDHHTSGSTGGDSCLGFVCENVLNSHDLPNGWLGTPLLDCPDECYWTVYGNNLQDDTRFLGTKNNMPIIMRTNWLERMRIRENGRIDINVSGNNNFLGKISFDNSASNGGNITQPVIKFYKPTGHSNPITYWPWWVEVGDYPNGNRLDIKTGNEAAFGDEIMSPPLMTILHNGNVGIGVTDPKQELVVNGTICAKEVRVSLSGSPCWEDYVFDKNYNLRTIDELENFIKENKHLPDIPNAKEVESNGIELGEMQAKLLKKIEELTLYIIELKKENKEIKNFLNNKQIKFKNK